MVLRFAYVAVDPSLLIDLAGEDFDLQKRARELLHKMLDEAEYQLECGTPASRLAVLRIGLPVVMKGIGENGDSEPERLVNLRVELSGLMKELRSGGEIVEAEVVDEDALEDAPPTPPSP